jgi:hypothetical protein
MSGMKYFGRAAVGVISPHRPYRRLNLGSNSKDKNKNPSWEDGADETDDMVVWASHACESWTAAAVADDRDSDIKA